MIPHWLSNDSVLESIDTGERPAAIEYLESLRKHVHFVVVAGRRLGVSEEQLYIHDQSKLSDAEFPFAARQYYGEGDPVGYAHAWLHHMNGNPHHHQYWVFPDGFSPKDSGVENGAVEMPEEFALEMVADWMGSSMAYTDSWDMTKWLTENLSRIRLHTNTAAYIRDQLKLLGYADVLSQLRFAHE